MDPSEFINERMVSLLKQMALAIEDGCILIWTGISGLRTEIIDTDADNLPYGLMLDAEAATWSVDVNAHLRHLDARLDMQ